MKVISGFGQEIRTSLTETYQMIDQILSITKRHEL